MRNHLLLVLCSLAAACSNKASQVADGAPGTGGAGGGTGTPVAGRDGASAADTLTGGSGGQADADRDSAAPIDAPAGGKTGSGGVHGSGGAGMGGAAGSATVGTGGASGSGGMHAGGTSGAGSGGGTGTAGSGGLGSGGATGSGGIGSGGVARTGGAGAGGSSAAGGAGGAADAGSLPAPTFAVEMTKADQSLFYGRSGNDGRTSFGVANASAADNAVAELVFKGDPALGPSDKLNPEYATEIGTNDGNFRYGTYRTRVQLARCSASEELVNGIFTYFNDGKDHDGDGLIDNSEIDIEILCSNPAIISLTIWSEYTSDAAGKNQHVTRTIDTKTGDYEDTLNYSTVLGSGNDTAFKHSFPDPNAFYEMGFEWHAAKMRYFIVLDGQEITLWTYTDSKYIPTLPASFLFNVWHSSDWWDENGTADYPAADAVMRIDWLRYWKE
jgi:hypothetical protein